VLPQENWAESQLFAPAVYVQNKRAVLISIPSRVRVLGSKAMIIDISIERSENDNELPLR
jgi:hypothetical protein